MVEGKSTLWTKSEFIILQGNSRDSRQVCSATGPGGGLWRQLRLELKMLHPRNAIVEVGGGFLSGGRVG